MKNFIGFLNEADEKVTETIELRISPKLELILKRIQSNNIAKEILSNIGNKLSDVSYLDVTEKDSKNISFLPLGRAKKVESESGDYYGSSLRQGMNWGKMVNKLFPGKFSNLEIDAFYDRYRPEIDAKKEESRFKMMRGDDVRIWYNEKMYNGEMSSCMRYDKCGDFFKIYTENPEKVGLLVYLDESGQKAYGRALVWNNLLKPSGDTKENKDPYTLLDRVYCVSGKQSTLAPMFKKYAIDNGWIYKDGDSYYMDGVRKTTSVATRLKPKDYGKYPYMDTMQYFTPMTGRAASTAGNPGKDPKDPSKVFKRFNLRSQTGGYSNLD